MKASRGELQLVDLSYTSPAITDQEDQSALNVAFVATETLLGEEVLDKWIGGIEVVPAPRRKGLKSLFGRGATELPHYIGLERLNETVTAVIDSMREQLPPGPHHEWIENAQWTLWELKPDEANDYPHQTDIFVGKSAIPEMWTAAHSGRLFSSERFSRCGEIFCYVKVDGSEGLGEAGFADKSEIEDALDAVLKPAKLGCHVGGGTGLRYSYVDLALTDVDKAIPMIAQRLRAGNIPKRTWIQFFDSDWAGEWIGVYEDTPPPPMESE